MFEPIEHGRRRLDGQTCLANPARTGKGKKPAASDERLNLHKLLLAADEAGQRSAKRGKWTVIAANAWIRFSQFGHSRPNAAACQRSSTPEQCCSVRIVQSQGFNQALNCPWIREAAHAPLEVRNAACTQSGLLRERLLGQPNGEPVAPQ
jgi:hypothetical protein